MKPDNNAPLLLIVDDDEHFCNALSRAMERRGFRVAQSFDSATAVRLAEELSPAYAIVDLRIGEESGLPLIQALLGLNGAMRIIVLTGYASVATAVEAVKLGATDYLTKPAHPDDIAAAFDREAGDAQTPPATQPMSVRRLEWEHLQRVLLKHKGNISAAARALNMHRRTLQRKLQKRPVAK